VFEEGVFRRILVVVHDVTHQVVTETRERDARERHQLLAHLLKDKQGFLEFVRDTERLLSDLHAEPDRALALRTLHTLKGNTAVFGMESVAERCHALEEHLAERSDGPTAREAQELSELWRGRLGRIEELLTTDSQLAIKEEDFTELVQGLRQRRDYAELTALVESFRWTQTSLLLQRFAAQAERVAERLEKNVAVRVEHNDLRLLPGKLEDFWSSFIHAVRNAVDHGLETEDERVALGKSPAGNVVLRTFRTAEAGLCVELADDGRGIDFERLRAVCEERGLPTRTRAELIEGMFQNGVTTREEVTETSGRGVGLGAVVFACRAAGGKVEVDSRDAKGTRFRFVFPKHSVEVREGVTRAHAPKPERKRPSMAAPAS
jgi:two-component system chemotaxis sensor kinase CheA